MVRADPDSGFWFHGEWISDPYEWLERFDDPEVMGWIEEQEAVTHAVLDVVPTRERIRTAVTRFLRYDRASRPIRAGGREFVWQAAPDDEKLALRMRREPDGPLETVLDPNTWLSTETLVYAVPSPDGKLVAFGKATGSTHDARIGILEIDTGFVLPDEPGGTRQEMPVWRPDSASFFYPAVADGKEVVLEHRIGAGDDRQVFGGHRDYWCSVSVSHCGRYAVLYQWDFVHANIVSLLRLADDELVPVATTMQAVRPGEDGGQDAGRGGRGRAVPVAAAARLRARRHHPSRADRAGRRRAVLLRLGTSDLIWNTSSAGCRESEHSSVLMARTSRRAGSTEVNVTEILASPTGRSSLGQNARGVRR